MERRGRFAQHVRFSSRIRRRQRQPHSISLPHRSGIVPSFLSLDPIFPRAARLRQSILKRAFEGKLVPQDPKDEPASTLLERLRASRTHDEANGTAATSKRNRAKIKESSGEPRTRIRRRASTRNQQEE